MIVHNAIYFRFVNY